MLDSLLGILVPVGIVLVALTAIGLMFAKLYKKTTKELSYVRTGFGGEKVVMNGGAIILPILHDTVSVNMQTLKLTVARAKTDSLTTKDKMRVDITADFYIRVKKDIESIATAAQTLGSKTLTPDTLKQLIEGKLVDSLRSVASSMSMNDLHEKRSDFVQEVQKNLLVDLGKNGLELESVSLTTFNQTELQFFDENNGFDAVGLKNLTEVIEKNKKDRNDIVRNNQIAIQEKDLETKKQALTYEEEQALAEAEQKTRIEKNKAEQAAEAEQSRIENEKKAEQTKIEAEQSIDEAKIKRSQALEVAKQNSVIEISNKSIAESEAKREANEKKAAEIKSAENVITTKLVEETERTKKVALILAEQKAEEESIGIKVAATANKMAAIDNAEAIKVEAEAQLRKYEVEAEGKEKINKAENIISTELIAMRLQEALIARMPEIIAQVVSPMKNIESIKIVDMAGLNSGQTTVNGSVSSNECGGNSLADNFVNGALKYQLHAPFIKNMFDSIGLDPTSMAGLTKPLTNILEVKNPSDTKGDSSEDHA